MISYPNRAPGTLSDSHRRMLFEESAISPEIAEERGYYTARRRSEVPEAFRDYQRKPGLVVPMFSPDGETVGYQLRPDRPRKGGPKYETPGGISPVVDVHPRMHEEVRSGSGPLLITEGAKTGDAATSQGIPTVMLAGVWMWCVPKVKPYRLKPCFDHVRLEGREVYVAFDSDCMSKAGVQDALAALVATLEDRCAAVKVIYLPDATDGSKQGIDDYLAAGGTIREMFMLAREFDPADVGRIRLSRDEKLRAGAAYLWQDWHERDWMRFVGDAEHPNWQRGHTARDIKEALIRLASRVGKVDDRGIVIGRTGLRRIAELAAKSAPSAGGALKHLEKDGQLEILPVEDRSKARSYRLLVPRAALYSMEEGQTEGTRVGNGSPSCKGLRAPTAPRLRWSSPAVKVRRLRGVTPGTRRVRQTRRFHKSITVKESRDHFPDRPYVKRLGPHRCAILDALEDAGGWLTLQELCEALHRSRPRDVRRRILPMLEKAGIIEIEGDVVRLVVDWLARLEEERERTGEISHAEEQREDHRKQREHYRDYLQAVKHLPSKAGEDAITKGHAARVEGLAAQRERAAAATKTEERRRAEAFVRDRLRELDRIRFSLLQDIWHDAGGDPWTIPQAVEALGCRVEELEEFGNRRFVFPPTERVA